MSEEKTVIEPYIPASESLPEITVKAVILGVLLSAVLAAANAYLGLKVGLTVSASIPAAVMSMAILRLFKRSNILENNIVQTAASAGESLVAGVIFTLPALILLRYWTDFKYWEVAGISAVGGMLGVLFTIPLRRALIIESDLKFPEGIATGEILKAGSEGGEGVAQIAWAGGAAAILKLFQSGFKLVSGSVSGGVNAGKSVFGFGCDLAPALVAVGYIVGLNIAILVFAGGCISWLFAIPIYTAIYDLPAEWGTGYDAAITLWSKKIRYMGVGAMVVGGLWALVSLVVPITAGIKSSLKAFRDSRSGSGVDVPRTERDTPINILGLIFLALMPPLVLVYRFVIDQDSLGVASGPYWTVIIVALIFAAVAGFVFSSVAGYMAGLVGSSNNPISGVTIASVLTVSLILYFLLKNHIDFATATSQALAAAATAILVGGVVCCSAAIAGDNMQDLKAGQIVGATPWKQQVMQMIGVLSAAITIPWVLHLLLQAYGLGDFLPRAGMDAAEALKAPQASLMQSVAQGVFAQNLPWTMIIIGAVIAVAIIALDKVLEAKGSEFRTPVLAVAVGIYLPVELSVPIFVGGLVAHFADRAIRRSARPEEAEVQAEKAGRRGLLFASGLITGEALVGIGLAIPFAIAQNNNVLKIAPEGFTTIANILGLLAIAGISYWTYRVASRPESA